MQPGHLANIISLILGNENSNPWGIKSSSEFSGVYLLHYELIQVPIIQYEVFESEIWLKLFNCGMFSYILISVVFVLMLKFVLNYGSFCLCYT